MTDALRTTQTPGPPTTAGTTDNPMCTCCTPQQPLELIDPGKMEYQCPVRGLKYTYDPAEGVVRQAQAAPAQTVVDQRENMYPESPSRDAIRQVNPLAPFSG